LLIYDEIGDFFITTDIVDDKINGDKDAVDVCCFGEDINDEHCEGETEDEHPVVEDIDGEHSVEDNNEAYDGGKISIDKGGDEGIDDEERICEVDDDNDSEVLFDGRLDVSSG
jgi:hypothetical protein